MFFCVRYQRSCRKERVSTITPLDVTSWAPAIMLPQNCYRSINFLYFIRIETNGTSFSPTLYRAASFGISSVQSSLLAHPNAFTVKVQTKDYHEFWKVSYTATNSKLGL
jgi:hypothetical protein